MGIVLQFIRQCILRMLPDESNSKHSSINSLEREMSNMMDSDSD